MAMPQAFQAEVPFKTDIGGIDPALFKVDTMSAPQFDSWLTVGETQGHHERF
jgi:hypothetical protein